MTRVLVIARRELWATVTTRGFLVAMLLIPVLALLSTALLPTLGHDAAPPVHGELALVDLSGEVAERVASALATRAGDAGARLTLRDLGRGAELEQAKRALAPGGPRVALAIVDRNAVVRNATGEYGAYELYVRKQLDDRVERAIERVLADAIIDARARRSGLRTDEIRALVDVRAPEPRTVTEAGEHASGSFVQALLPTLFMLLVFMAVTVSGQSLMTATIEEKSSRVIEVLLSAVSPLELMSGKIIGQLGVGLLVLALYAGVGGGVLLHAGFLPLLDPLLVAYLLVSFLIAFFIIGSLMAAIGAAVSELRDAQSLYAPVMMLLMLPLILAIPISRDPGSTLSTVLSFVPPSSAFVMLIRVTSTAPPPAWQVGLSLLAGLVSAAAALWFAAKIFRVGLLVHGKPPSLATLVRWARES